MVGQAWGKQGMARPQKDDRAKQNHAAGSHDSGGVSRAWESFF